MTSRWYHIVTIERAQVNLGERTLDMSFASCSMQGQGCPFNLHGIYHSPLAITQHSRRFDCPFVFHRVDK